MNIGSFGGSFPSVQQGFFNSNGDLISRMTNLAEQRRAASDINNFRNQSVQQFFNNFNTNTNTNNFNQALFNNLERVGAASAELRSQVSSMSTLNQFSPNIGRTASSSESEVLSATVARGAAVSSHTRTDVNVTQLASGQENTSNAMRADENSFGGSFSFSVTDNAGRTNTFSVNLAENDDNRSAMQSMAAQINASASNTGIRASLVEDEENGTVSLQLSNSRTGETDGRFTVNDESGANLNNVTSEAANAQFSVNGVNQSSQTNNVTLQQGVTATLNQTGSTQVTFQQDMSTATSSAQRFVDSFNSLRDAASGSDRLTNQLNQAARNFSRALGDSGISMNSEGRMSITDESRLTQSVSDGSFSRNFQGIGSLGDSLQNISRNAYRTAYDSAVQQNFTNMMNNLQSQSNRSSAGSWMNDWLSMPASGLLFNMRI